MLASWLTCECSWACGSSLCCIQVCIYWRCTCLHQDSFCMFSQTSPAPSHRSYMCFYNQHRSKNADEKEGSWAQVDSSTIKQVTKAQWDHQSQDCNVLRLPWGRDHRRVSYLACWEMAVEQWLLRHPSSPKTVLLANYCHQIGSSPGFVHSPGLPVKGRVGCFLRKRLAPCSTEMLTRVREPSHLKCCSILRCQKQPTDHCSLHAGYS